MYKSFTKSDSVEKAPASQTFISTTVSPSGFGYLSLYPPPLAYWPLFIQVYHTSYLPFSNITIYPILSFYDTPTFCATKLSVFSVHPLSSTVFFLSLPLFLLMLLSICSIQVYVAYAFECCILVSFLLGSLSNQREMTHL